jgi:hypothetical protein
MSFKIGNYENVYFTFKCVGQLISEYFNHTDLIYGMSHNGFQLLTEECEAGGLKWAFREPEYPFKFWQELCDEVITYRP